MWKDSYQIGVQQLDDQHKLLLLRTEDLLKALRTPGAGFKEECKGVLQFLKGYAAIHFGAEEHYQETIRFPQREAHKKLHEAFSDQMREYEWELIRTDYDPETVREVASYLTRWWIYHIVREDKKMMAVKKEP